VWRFSYKGFQVLGCQTGKRRIVDAKHIHPGLLLPPPLFFYACVVLTFRGLHYVCLQSISNWIEKSNPGKKT
jgi:hypothetical protein